MRKLLQNDTDKPIKIIFVESKTQSPAIIINGDKYEVGEYNKKKRCYPLKFVETKESKKIKVELTYYYKDGKQVIDFNAPGNWFPVPEGIKPNSKEFFDWYRNQFGMDPMWR